MKMVEAIAEGNIKVIPDILVSSNGTSGSLSDMLLTDYDIAKRYPEDQRGDGHGGKVETSRVMAIAPQLVRPQAKVGRYVSQGFMILADPERSMPNGFVGDAPSATAELGSKVNAFIVDELTKEIVKEFGVKA